ncbi:type IV secretory system conjugative DNA transfer family protein [Geothrix sp. PMB-07]|uniref:type IV secretory system conjugative DNA transfer family protein n=1 Tax=Geothrix sp. PMB-07 TaxID=3068640 RepID=UPI002741674D|nr:type IV secretion system DNA-binding domain-containing protein [Geothrix sp. PMB-07]WLT33342.1 type IV secretion system DNA-binding domain-containing protein [Geothrix sp. PMB-07]
MQETIKSLLNFWNLGGTVTVSLLGLIGIFFYSTRWFFIHREDPLKLLRSRGDKLYRTLFEWRPKRLWLPFCLALLSIGMLVRIAISRIGVEEWAHRRPELFLAAHVGILFGLFLIFMIFRDKLPAHVKAGTGRSDAKWHDPKQDWGRTFKDTEGKNIYDNSPVAAVLAYRSPCKAASRTLIDDQRHKRNLTAIQIRWDIVAGHIFVLGAQGSGKTTTWYSHIMHSASCPWIYQDSKAELPWREENPNLPVFGLDVRGYQTRSGVLNFLEEAKTPEDLDLIVDYVFPVLSHDNNPWVRLLAREMFRAILTSRRWDSLQEISRALTSTPLKTYLAKLPPIWQNLMSEEKTSVPVLGDMVTTLGKWETPRVAAITEGHSTVTIDDFLAKGGYVMNCEMSDALRAPVHLFWAMLLGRLRNRPEGSSKILLLMDEFGDAGRLPNIENALILLRSKGVGIVAGVQNFGILEKVYGRDLKAVTKGFGTKILLARRLEDEYREQMTKNAGKFTLRFKTAGANQEQERESELLPASEWGRWSEEGAALSRINGWTYWLPLSIPTPPTPLGPRMEEVDPWQDPTSFDEEPPDTWDGLKQSAALQELPKRTVFSEDQHAGMPRDPDFF